MNPDIARLLKCFEPRPLPDIRPGQMYQPANESWYERNFNYRVGIRFDTSDVSNDRILLGGTQGIPFFDIKADMQADPARWGEYRKDWFGTISKGWYYWYFMDGQTAMLFRLWVPL